MLRPRVVIHYAKERTLAKLSDFDQLLNGLNVGGRIIVGGSPQVATTLRGVATQQKRMGVIASISEVKDPKLDPFITYAFDITCVAQLLMIAQNEAFHEAVDQSINLIQDLVVVRGEKVETALQVLREQADKIGHL